MPRAKKQPPAPESLSLSAKTLGGVVASGKRMRETLDNPQQGLFFSKLFQTPTDDETEWRSLSLDSQTLDRMAPADLLNRLANLSPDLSRALWDFLRMTNPGHEVKCYGADGKTVDKRAQTSADAFVARLNARYGSIDVVIHRLFINAFLRGGFFAEVVFDNSGKQAIDIATPDSRYLYFERDLDPQYGLIWRPFQWQAGVKRYLDTPTVRYVPVDPLPGSPYGRAPAQPALFTIIFMLGLLHDLRRVVAQQGWPRLDVSINAENLFKVMPEEAKSSLKARDDWARSVLKEVQDEMAALEPDDTYVHMDTTQFNRPQGTVDSSSLGAIDGLIAALDRFAMRSLKSNNLLFGINEGGSETQGNRLWELWAASCKAIQHLAEGLLEYFFTLALQAEGLQAKVEFRFAEIRAAELLRDGQVLKLALQNAALAYERGWINQDEAATMALGREKADRAGPRLEGAGIQAAGSTGGATNPDTVAADPGSARSRLISLLGEDVFDGPEQLTNGNGNGKH